MVPVFGQRISHLLRQINSLMDVLRSHITNSSVTGITMSAGDVLLDAHVRWPVTILCALKYITDTLKQTLCRLLLQLLEET